MDFCNLPFRLELIFISIDKSKNDELNNKIFINEDNSTEEINSDDVVNFYENENDEKQKMINTLKNKLNMITN